MKIAIIIQARMGSTRLKGKVLKTLEEHTVLGHVLLRSQLVKKATDIVVATTNLIQDDVIACEAVKYNVNVTRGSETDVLARYYDAALSVKANHIIRITSDCPLIDSNIIDELISYYLDGKYDYARIGLDCFPRGMDAEIFSFALLEEAYKCAYLPFDREHVTTYIQTNRDKFKFGVFRHQEDYSHVRLTLDTPEDWKLISYIFEKLSKQHGVFGWGAVKKLLEAEPHIIEINSNVEQKHNNI